MIAALPRRTLRGRFRRHRRIGPSRLRASEWIPVLARRHGDSGESWSRRREASRGARSRCADRSRRSRRGRQVHCWRSGRRVRMVSLADLGSRTLRRSSTTKCGRRRSRTGCRSGGMRCRPRTMSRARRPWRRSGPTPCARISARDLPAARAKYGQVLELQPGYAPGHYLLGVVLRDSGDLASARQSFAAAVAAAPAFVDARVALAKAAQATGDVTGAIAACTEGSRSWRRRFRSIARWGSHCSPPMTHRARSEAFATALTLDNRRRRDALQPWCCAAGLAPGRGGCRRVPACA